jgi:transposase
MRACGRLTALDGYNGGMNWATGLAAFAPSPELVEWVQERVTKLADEAAQALRWRDLKIEKLTLELAHLRRMRFGATSETFAAAHRDLFDETLAADIAACEAEREAAAIGPQRPLPPQPPRRASAAARASGAGRTSA